MAKSSKVQSPPAQNVETKNLVSLIDAKLTVLGRYSGRKYLFDRAGSIIDVNQEDVEWMLSLRQGERQCCGGSATGNKMFELA